MQSVGLLNQERYERARHEALLRILCEQNDLLLERKDNVLGLLDEIIVGWLTSKEVVTRSRPPLCASRPSNLPASPSPRLLISPPHLPTSPSPHILTSSPCHFVLCMSFGMCATRHYFPAQILESLTRRDGEISSIIFLHRLWRA